MTARPSRPPGVIRCMTVLATVKAALTTQGFSPTLRWIERRSATRCVSASINENQDELVTSTEYAVAMAGALFPGRALCLEQSLTLYYFLRRAGVASELRIGVQPNPFAAHAWVEVKGIPVNDVREHVEWFTPLADPAAEALS